MDDRLYDENRRSVHKVYLNARKTAVLSGVRDVLSFDAKEQFAFLGNHMDVCDSSIRYK